MGTVGDKSAPKNRRAPARSAGPGLGYRIWRFVVEHPKGVLIGAATLLGLIVVFQNWRSTRAYLLVTDVALPFVLWALIFMVVGYLTGKWIEWGWRQRKIRKGTYKPRVSPEALADASASLEERLARGESGEEGAPVSDAARAGVSGDQEDPSTIIDRGGKAPLPEGPRGAPDGRRGYSPVVEGAALGNAPSPRLHRGPGDRYGGEYVDTGRYVDQGPGQPVDQSGGRYGDYGDAGRYVDQGVGGRYVDQGAGGRYVDQGAGGRYVDQGVGGRYVDQGAGGRYVDQGGGGRYVDQGGGGRYGDYGDYGDAGRPEDPQRGRR